MGLPGTYTGSGIYPADRARPLFRRLHDQLVLERVPGNPGPYVRPPLRAGVPARPGGEGAGGDLPPEKSGRRLQGRHPRSPAETRSEKERQTHRAGRRRPGLSHRRPRSRPARLPLRGVRPGSKSRRNDPHANPEIPPARFRHRRGMRLHPRPWRRIPRRQAHRQHEGAAGRKLGCDLRRLRRAARARPRHSRPQGSGQEYSYRHRLALVGLVRPHRQDRQARRRARRRQHRDGLLPLRPPARRRTGRCRRPLRL